MHKLTVSLMLAIIFLFAAVSLAQVEPVISYQGVLTDDSGAPLDGTFDMNFRIMDDTDILWEELHIGVPVDSGFFSVMLGDTDPIPPDAFVNESDSSGYVMRYLQVQVGVDPPMTPISRLLTVPYSMAAHRMAGDIFTSPGSIRMGVEPVPFLPLMEMNVFQDSASIRMGVEPEPFQPTVEINTNPNTSSFRMGVEPQPFQPAVEINASQNTTTFSMGIEPDPFSPDPEVVISMDSNSTSFRMGVDPEPFYPTVEINSSVNTTSFSMGIEPEPFDPAPEMEMLMDESSTTFRMGVDPQPFNPSVEFQALTDMTSFTMFDPTAGPNGGAISEMTASVGGQFSWVMFNPQPEPPGRPIMDMNTGPGGEISWVMFNPQPEPPGEPLMKFVTYGDPTGADILLFEPPPGTSTSPNVDIYTQDGQGGIILRQSSTGFTQYQSPQTISFVDGGSGVSVGAISPASNSYLMGNFSLGTSNATNILTIAQGSTTDPIADAWTVYSSRRWKENIRTIDKPLDKVERLRGVTFDWKADGKHDIGLIAEEVGEVIPEVVAYEDNGVDARSVDYARLVSVLIEAVKEQQAEIDELKDKLQQVTSRVEYRDESGDVRYSNREIQGGEK